MHLIFFPLNNHNSKRQLLFEQHRKCKSMKYLSWKDLNFSISLNLNPVSYCTYVEVYIHVINNLSSMWNETYLGDIVDWSFIYALSQNILRLTQQIGSFLQFEMHYALSSCDFFFHSVLFTAASSCGVGRFQFISRYLQYLISSIFSIFVLFCLNPATENNLWTLHLLNPLFCPPLKQKGKKE